MPTIAANTTAITTTNAPAFGPTGYAFNPATITPDDLAAGVTVFCDKYQGGPQTVLAVIDVHYHAHDEQFFAVTERPSCEYLTVNLAGQKIGRRPVYTVRHNEVIDQIAADLLCEAFRKGEINVEYPISRKVQATYAQEIRLLSDGIIESGAEGFTIGIDNADSSAKRKRHGYDSEMIRSMADLIAREDLRTGFVYSSSGPGNAIIEALRRCHVPVGKKITSTSSLTEFARLTTRLVAEQWDKGYSHRNVDSNHAWKYDRNQPHLRPDLLNLDVKSAILSLTRGNLAVKQHATVKALRAKIAKAQTDAAAHLAANPVATGSRRRVTQQAAPAMQPEAVETEDRMETILTGLSSRLTRNGNPARDGVIAQALLRNHKMVGLKNVPGTQDEAFAYANGGEFQELSRRIDAISMRAKVYCYGAWAVLHEAMKLEDAAAAATFFDAIKAKSRRDPSHPVTAMLNALGAVDREARTSEFVISLGMRAWRRHLATLTTANDNEAAQGKAA